MFRYIASCRLQSKLGPFFSISSSHKFESLPHVRIPKRGLYVSRPPSSSSSPLQKTDSLTDCIKSRHSIRYFLPDPVLRETLDECLSLAQLAPSNSNTQPWRLFLASGPARRRLRDALMAEAKLHGPSIQPLPESFRQCRSDLGRQLYGPDGYNISREDTQGRQAAVLRNYEFFGAPLIGAVCMPKIMGTIDALGVGMWLQTLMLALTKQGLGTCAQVSVAGYPEVLRRELKIEDELDILCGLAIGWPESEQRLNKMITGRHGIEKCVSFIEE